MISLVTPFYDDDKLLLLLQARSVACHMDAGLIDCIHLLYNGEDFEAARGFVTNALLPHYGDFAFKVVLHNGLEMLGEGASGYGGWIRQQALKLSANLLATTDWYMVLDAKNHFIKPVRAANLFDGDKAVAFLMNNEQSLGAEYQASQAFTGNISRFEASLSPQCHTPCLLHARSVKTMLEQCFSGKIIGFLDAAEGQSVTEFFLYWAWLEKENKLDDLYSFREQFVSNIWPKSPENDLRFKRRIAESTYEAIHTYGVHLRAFSALKEGQISVLLGVWEKAGLLTETELAAVSSKLKDGLGVEALAALISA